MSELKQLLDEMLKHCLKCPSSPCLGGNYVCSFRQKIEGKVKAIIEKAKEV